MDQELLKIKTFDAHDRLDYLKQSQSKGIDEMIEMYVKDKPFGEVPFYLFAHKRTGDYGEADRLIWQPRLTKPKAQTNSMLFRIDPDIDGAVTIIWILPPREMWHLYEKGKMFENEVVIESVYDFEHDRNKLERPQQGDLNDEQIKTVYKSAIQPS
jgi:hypothetical protein